MSGNCDRTDAATPDGPLSGPDRPILESYLRWQRATLVNICAGLNGEQLAARPARLVPTVAARPGAAHGEGRADLVPAPRRPARTCRRCTTSRSARTTTSKRWTRMRLPRRSSDYRPSGHAADAAAAPLDFDHVIERARRALLAPDDLRAHDRRVRAAQRSCRPAARGDRRRHGSLTARSNASAGRSGVGDTSRNEHPSAVAAPSASSLSPTITVRVGSTPSSATASSKMRRIRLEHAALVREHEHRQVVGEPVGGDHRTRIPADVADDGDRDVPLRATGAAPARCRRTGATPAGWCRGRRGGRPARDSARHASTVPSTPRGAPHGRGRGAPTRRRGDRVGRRACGCR